MPTEAHLVAFAGVSLGLALTPGPNMIYLMSRSISQGRLAGLVSLCGVGLAFVIYLLCTTQVIATLLLHVPYGYKLDERAKKTPQIAGLFEIPNNFGRFRI